MSDTRTTWAGRLSAGWGRAESTVTKLFLAAVFLVGLVAQFVKPVGDALQDKVYLGGALLTVVGYVLYAEVQRLNSRQTEQGAAERELHGVARRLDDEVRRLNEVLRPRGISPRQLEAQFGTALDAGPEVRISVMGFTGETVAEPLVHILQGLRRHVPRTVRLRVLVPDFTKEIDVPGLVGADGRAGDAREFRESLLAQIAGYEGRLRDMSGRMADEHRGTLIVEFRVLHMSPSLKLYFINDDVVYEGIYDKIVLRRPSHVAGSPARSDPDGSGGRLLDLLGYDSLLTRWSSDGGEQARTVIRRRRELFDTLWDAARPFSADVPTRTAPARPGNP